MRIYQLLLTNGRNVNANIYSNGVGAGSGVKGTYVTIEALAAAIIRLSNANPPIPNSSGSKQHTDKKDLLKNNNQLMSNEFGSIESWVGGLYNTAAITTTTDVTIPKSHSISPAPSYPPSLDMIVINIPPFLLSRTAPCTGINLSDGLAIEYLPHSWK